MLFVLAFDHRNSLRTGFFGIEGLPTAAQEAQCREAKEVILDGLLHALERGLPAGEPGVLVDDEYGTAVARRARRRGVKVAIPVESSGRRELAFEHEPFFASIEALDADYAKVLVRYNPGAEPEINERQRAKLLRVQEWAATAGRGFMLELLVPPEPEQLANVGADPSRYDSELRPSLTLAAVRELTDAGLHADLWKLEGMNSGDEYASIADVVLRSCADSRCLVLGRGADEEAVDRWLELAAPVRGFAGFAVGRTIWWKPLRAYYDGHAARGETVDAIAANYRRLVGVYLGSQA